MSRRYQEPDPGPYWIEMDTHDGRPNYADCNVVDIRRPIGGDGEGFVVLFTGTYAECDAWLEAHPA